ncbi:MAG TPA: hypothetical protein VMS65_08795, partial [Polyangiaceae bacterium]|nr:hypothetical protein [Polyangiaceae bacterium]
AATCNADTVHGCSFQPNVVGCRESEAGCAPGLCRSGDPFVRRVGATLWLHEYPYTFVGAVSWGIAWAPDGCQVLGTQAEALERTFGDLVDARVSVLKVWAFQSYAGPSGTDFSSFDRIVEAARRAGVRLIFVLENHWDDCSHGGTRDDAWYASGHASPYGGYALSLPDYARAIVAHFRNEPTVVAWELMHEAHGEDFASLDGFSRTLSALVRESDPNHLIALGIDNGSSPATNHDGAPSNYERLHDHGAIDLLDAHDFSTPEVALPSGLLAIADAGKSIGKPFFAGATGVEASNVSRADLDTRAAVVEGKLEAALATGYVGFLVYDYLPDWEPPSWSFDGRPDDALAGPDGVLARHAPPVH